MIFKKLGDFFENIFQENSLTDIIIDFIENILPALFIKIKGFYSKHYSFFKILFAIVVTCRTAYLIFFLNKKESVYNLHHKLFGQIINIIFLIISLNMSKIKKIKS